MENSREIASKSDYHLVHLSARRFGVAKILSYINSTDDAPSHLRFTLVPGLEKIPYGPAVEAVNDLNAGRTNDSSYAD